MSSGLLCSVNEHHPDVVVQSWAGKPVFQISALIWKCLFLFPLSARKVYPARFTVLTDVGHFQTLFLSLFHEDAGKQDLKCSGE